MFKIFEKKQNFWIFLIKCVLCTILLEFTIFNINYYRVNFSKLKKISFNEDSINETIDSNENKEVKLDNINENIKSIYIDVLGDDCFDYEIHYSDETTVDRLLGTKTYCNAVENTKYTVIDLSRKCKKYNYKVNR